MADLLPLRRPAHDPEPLWRQLLGEQLRRRRHARGERLTDTARRAGVSPQYLSEVERGLKEPSSEMIAAIGGALGATLADLTTAVAAELQAAAASAVVRDAPSPAPVVGAVALAA